MPIPKTTIYINADSGLCGYVQAVDNIAGSNVAQMSVDLFKYDGVS